MRRDPAHGGRSRRPDRGRLAAGRQPRRPARRAHAPRRGLDQGRQPDRVAAPRQRGAVAGVVHRQPRRLPLRPVPAVRAHDRDRGQRRAPGGAGARARARRAAARDPPAGPTAAGPGLLLRPHRRLDADRDGLSRRGRVPRRAAREPGRRGCDADGGPGARRGVARARGPRGPRAAADVGGRRPGGVRARAAWDGGRRRHASRAGGAAADPFRPVPGRRRRHRGDARRRRPDAHGAPARPGPGGVARRRPVADADVTLDAVGPARPRGPAPVGGGRTRARWLRSAR